MNKKDTVILISTIGTLALGLSASFFYITLSSKYKEDEVDTIEEPEVQQYM